MQLHGPTSPLGGVGSPVSQRGAIADNSELRDLAHDKQETRDIGERISIMSIVGMIRRWSDALKGSYYTGRNAMVVEEGSLGEE
ncbi:hypothetical protein JTE90_004507 [Oedothorax gibbosus]|uniref:Uncharacterized protein n=1 Tax=Oedothorax gibbosus TaxID=931172 RepID=A0AAV6U3L8_9ARAC|nr:hypothetical protein JTE90_004507 [Oedothorax gibbosus]